MRMKEASCSQREQLTKDIAYLKDAIGRVARADVDDTFKISYDRQLVDQIIDALKAINEDPGWNTTERLVTDRGLGEYYEVLKLEKQMNTPPTPDTPDN